MPCNQFPTSLCTVWLPITPCSVVCDHIVPFAQKKAQSISFNFLVECIGYGLNHKSAQMHFHFSPHTCVTWKYNEIPPAKKKSLTVSKLYRIHLIKQKRWGLVSGFIQLNHSNSESAEAPEVLNWFNKTLCSCFLRPKSSLFHTSAWNSGDTDDFTPKQGPNKLFWSPCWSCKPPWNWITLVKHRGVISPPLFAFVGLFK